MKAKTILCFASYEKGHEFLRQCKREGWRVILLTSYSLKNKAHWPEESIDEVFYIPDVKKEWKMKDVINGVSFMSRTEQIDRIVALEDYDVEKAAALREHLRTPGMGDTTSRYFRDKLAMRARALSAGIAVPEFVHILNYDRISEYLDRVPFPHVLKPRLQAGAHGITKVHSKEELWDAVEQLGDKQSYYVLERFIPGEVFHVDTLLQNSEIRFAVASKYAKPPLEVAHDGKVFCTRNVVRNSEEDVAMKEMNRQVLSAMGLVQGVSHTEFIRAEDGKIFFLETSARVGGAHIVELVEAATGLNLWAEWAKIETRGEGVPYAADAAKSDYAGLLVSLAKQEWPDISACDAPEIVWRLQKKHHAGLIISSQDYDRVTQLLDQYTHMFYEEFHTRLPHAERPTE